MKKPRFVVTGCARSGTTYMSKILSSIGHECSHERIFNLYHYRDSSMADDVFAAFPHLQGDSSSDAVLFLDRLPVTSVVLHQVRHPLEVIRSLKGMRFFAEPFQPSIYLAEDHGRELKYLAEHVCPGVFVDTGELARCMRYWVIWNKMAQEAEGIASLQYFRYRLEDLDLELLRTIDDVLGGDANDEVLGAALDSISRSTNKRLRDESLTWDAIQDCEEKAAVERLATEYGYEMS